MFRILGVADVGSVHTHKWANYFAGRRHQVHLLSFRPVTAESRVALHPNVSVDPWILPELHLKRPWITVAALARLRAIQRQYRSHLVHVHYLGHAAWYAALARMHPLVISVMGGDVQGSAWQPSSLREKILTPLALRRSDLVLCWSHKLAKIVAPLIDLGHRPEVLVGGIDLSRFRRATETGAIRRSLGLEPDDFLILSPRLLWPLYNIEAIIRALGLALAVMPRARLLLVKHHAGAFPDYGRAMERLIDELGIRHAVRFVPSIPNAEMPLYYSAADCTVSIPGTDGTPMTVMESAACGTPTIILDLPDYDPRIFVHKRSVIRLARLDPQELAEAIVMLATDLEIRDVVRRDGRGMAERHADYHVEMGRLEKFYGALVTEGR